LNDLNIDSKIHSLLNHAITNLKSYDSDNYNNSLSLWRAYIDIEYAILVLKLSCNNIETKQQAIFKKSNIKNVTEKKILMKPEDFNHEIKQLKSVIRHLKFQDKKLLLDELRSNRDLLKNWLQKGSFNNIV
jgi:transcription initiation factor TFIID subunit TAF12